MTREGAIITLTNTASFLRDGTRYFKPEHEKQFREAYEMAIKALEQPEAKTNANDDWVILNKEKILKAGMEGREVDFRIGGRLFAIREKAQ